MSARSSKNCWRRWSAISAAAEAAPTVSAAIGGFVADQQQEKQQSKLQYRSGDQDLRPNSDADVGCALVFGFIAMLMILGMAVTAYQFRNPGMTRVERLFAPAGFGLFAAGCIIAVVGRLTRHRWWANRDWKDWRPRTRAGHWAMVVLDFGVLALIAWGTGISIRWLIAAVLAGMAVPLVMMMYKRLMGGARGLNREKVRADQSGG
jgi:hypothetical protein